MHYYALILLSSFVYLYLFLNTLVVIKCFTGQVKLLYVELIQANFSL